MPPAKQQTTAQRQALLVPAADLANEVSFSTSPAPWASSLHHCHTVTGSHVRKAQEPPFPAAAHALVTLKPPQKPIPWLGWAADSPQPYGFCHPKVSSPPSQAHVPAASFELARVVAWPMVSRSGTHTSRTLILSEKLYKNGKKSS